ncbi:metal-dependent phosphodiesterase [Halobacillus halophilus]|uniref:Phosphoesterase n=2 Tax=Halobacillus halophilus TaxID=1570 RepID=I0JTM8_HALH3|nr:metallophosphoesterase [Halobacillus halophilus]ASF41568.1 metal-dependent phosphodiesterase [Halobacillus halophilus]CCG47501.1 probable phosphoesterase [Halobacillus halophilus DSM 2266]
MMKIVVLSDTHMPKKGKSLPERLVEELPSADAIIHTGDWHSKEVVEELKKYGPPLYGVYGNVDGEDIQSVFPYKQTIELNGFRIGLIHGHGEKKTTEKRAVEGFKGEEVDLIIFGHSHLPLTRYMNKVMLFNPGSVTDKRKMPYYSFGILRLEENIHAEHVFFT